MRSTAIPKYAEKAMRKLVETVRDENGQDAAFALWEAYESGNGETIMRELRENLADYRKFLSTRTHHRIEDHHTHIAGNMLVNVYEMLQALSEGKRARARALAANAMANYKRWEAEVGT